MYDFDVNDLTREQIFQVYQEYDEMGKVGYLAEGTLLRQLSEDACVNDSLFLMTVEAVAKSVFMVGTIRYLANS